MEVQSQSKPSANSIGVAHEEADGTIVLQLSVNEPGVRGDALYKYPRTHPDYEKVRRHIGEVPKGKSVEVQPFPEKW